MGEATDQRGAVTRLEFVEARAVDQPGNDLANVIGCLQIARHHTEDLVGVIGRLFGCDAIKLLLLPRVEIGDDPAGLSKRMAVIVGKMIGNAGKPGVDIASAQFLRLDHFTRCRLDQWRTSEKDRALLPDDNCLVAHRRNIGTACRT